MKEESALLNGYLDLNLKEKDSLSIIDFLTEKCVKRFDLVKLYYYCEKNNLLKELAVACFLSPDKKTMAFIKHFSNNDGDGLTHPSMFLRKSNGKVSFYWSRHYKDENALKINEAISFIVRHYILENEKIEAQKQMSPVFTALLDKELIHLIYAFENELIKYDSVIGLEELLKAYFESLKRREEYDMYIKKYSLPKKETYEVDNIISYILTNENKYLAYAFVREGIDYATESLLKELFKIILTLEYNIDTEKGLKMFEKEFRENVISTLDYFQILNTKKTPNGVYDSKVLRVNSAKMLIELSIEMVNTRALKVILGSLWRQIDVETRNKLIVYILKNGTEEEKDFITTSELFTNYIKDNSIEPVLRKKKNP